MRTWLVFATVLLALPTNASVITKTVPLAGSYPELNFGVLDPGDYIAYIRSDSVFTYAELDTSQDISTFNSDCGGGQADFVDTVNIFDRAVSQSSTPTHAMALNFTIPNPIATPPLYCTDGSIALQVIQVITHQATLDIANISGDSDPLRGNLTVRLAGGVPEPGIWIELVAGFVLLAFVLRRKPVLEVIGDA
ncbi:MAG TPA: hypothetical protein VGV14_10865 [Rhodanobacter sp.]|nr:hypothetical protein [Rhodanobacter sp.]